jgi:hypothetical protein
MSDALRDIVSISISRQTQAVQRASFGVYLIADEFATSKTTVAFSRYREYSSLTEMTNDGWVVTDQVYLEASALFSQNPRPDKIAVGRIDSGDASLTAALTAINTENSGWYSFKVATPYQAEWIEAATWAEANKKIHFIDASDYVTIVFDADLVTLNEIDVSVILNGVTTNVPTVTFSSDHDTTMGLIVAECIDAGFPAYLDPDDTDNRTIILFPGGPNSTVTAPVTEGATQAGTTVTNYDIGDPSSTTDIAYVLNAANRDRSVICYKKAYADEFAAAWNGERLPFDAGEATWAFKTLSGVTTDTFTTTQRNAVLNKSGNIYESVGGVSITQFGTVASEEYIDVIRGIDWLESRLQEEVLQLLINSDKVPYTDAGVQLVEGIIRGVLKEGVDQGLLAEGTIELTVPKVADVSAADKAGRILPDVEFSAQLAGAIHKVEITGVVTV